MVRCLTSILSKLNRYRPTCFSCSDIKRGCSTSAMDRTYNCNNMVKYEPPSWASQIQGAPTCKMQLAHLNTPIHKWPLPGVPEGYEVYIKRDDMTGSTLSGNKVRKLEFILADALQRGCKHVITCGGLQSNHCRATAVAARQVGLKPHLVLRADMQSTEDFGTAGNVFLNRMCGADIYVVPKHSPYETHMKPRMEQLAQKIKERTGEESCLIPVGGSDRVGLFGYLEAFNELLSQGVKEQFDDIVFACGSGGTAEGLALGNHLSGAGLRIHGIAVSDNGAYFHDHTQGILEELGVGHIKSQSIFNIIEDYKGQGYGISTQEELDFIAKVARETGIMIDPVYSGKAARGLVKELQQNQTGFKGKRILFIHTGGVFGLYDGKMEPTITAMENQDYKVSLWNDISSIPE